MATLSEALRRKLGKRDCPYLNDCAVKITKDYFSRICNSTTYINCHHYAKRMGELRTPIGWLQKLAIDQAKKIEQKIEV